MSQQKVVYEMERSGVGSEVIVKNCEGCRKKAYCIQLVRNCNGDFFLLCCQCLSKNQFFWGKRITRELCKHLTIFLQLKGCAFKEM